MNFPVKVSRESFTKFHKFSPSFNKRGEMIKPRSISHVTDDVSTFIVAVSPSAQTKGDGFFFPGYHILLLPSSPEVDFTGFFFPRGGKKKPNGKYDFQLSAGMDKKSSPVMICSTKLGKKRWKKT